MGDQRQGGLGVDLLGMAIACGITVILADLGLFSEFDAIGAAFFFAVLRPRLAPALLLTVASIQDAPGLAGIGWYLGLLAVGTVTLFYAAFRRVQSGAGLLRVNRWGASATALAIYAALIGMANFQGGGDQLFDRNPLVIGLLMVFMTWVGIAAAGLVREDEPAAMAVRWAAFGLVAHGLAVACLQLALGPTFLASSSGAVEIGSADQLMDASAIGIARIHGTFLSPNAFSLCMLLLLMLGVAVQPRRPVGRGFVLVWGGIGLILALLSLSKAIAIFVLICAAFMFLKLVGWRWVLIGAVPVAAGLLLVQAALPESLAAAFRVDTELAGGSYRALAWDAVVTGLHWRDWLFGVGLAYWKGFFEGSIGIPLSDPHTWLLSIPGTFGLFGTALFLVINGVLLRRARRGVEGVAVAALCLSVLFLVKDMFSISYLMGTSPISFLIWMLLGLVLVRPGAGTRPA